MESPGHVVIETFDAVGVLHRERAEGLVDGIVLGGACGCGQRHQDGRALVHEEPLPPRRRVVCACAYVLVCAYVPCMYM